MRILVFGDSISQGYFDLEKSGWVTRLCIDEYEKRMKSNGKGGSTIINLSVSGDTTGDLLKRVENDLKTRQWEGQECAAILTIGTNDASKSRGEYLINFDLFKENIEAIVSKLQTVCTKVVIIGFPAVFEGKSNPWIYESDLSCANDDLIYYDKFQEELAFEKGLIYIPLFDLLDTESDRHLPDGLHPNAEGHRLIYQRVKTVLEAEGLL